MSGEILRKYIDIINEQETLNEEILEEGMLQKLAGLALGTVLALGPKIGQADTIYSYYSPEFKKMINVPDVARVPAEAKVVMAVDTDTNEVTIVKGGMKGQQVQPDQASIKQGQQQAKQPQAQQPQAQQPQAQQPQAQQPQAQQPQQSQTDATQAGFKIKHIRLGMSEKEFEQAKKDAGVRSGLLSSKDDTGIDTILGVKLDRYPLSATFKDGKLVYLSDRFGLEPTTAAELIQQFTAKFGKPTSYENTEIMNKMGAKFPSTSATWIKDGAHIVIKTTGGMGRVDKGSIFIFDQGYLQKSGQERSQKKTSDLGDF